MAQGLDLAKWYPEAVRAFRFRRNVIELLNLIDVVLESQAAFTEDEVTVNKDALNALEDWCINQFGK